MNIQAYQAALNGVAYFYQTNAGFLRLGGADRLDFLQRQSTNDVRKLSADQIVITVLTSATARILDVFCLIEEGETLGVITLSGRQEETAKFLRNRIFFSDQVTVIDISSKYGQVLVVGPQAAVMLKNRGMQPPLLLNQVSKVDFGGLSLIVIAREILSGLGYHLLVPHSSVDTVLSTLAQAGAESLNLETFDVLRIEAGQPGPSGEFVDEYTPLEVGYVDMISGSKGCYTGQEIIARQITYDKITKHLVGFKLNHLVEPGTSLVLNGKSIGSLTSVTQSPRFGVIGLGIIRREFDELGAKLKTGTDIPVVAEITHLPFT